MCERCKAEDAAIAKAKAAGLAIADMAPAFKELGEAFSMQGRVALLEATRKSDGKKVAIVALHDPKMHSFTPMALMIAGDDSDDYEPNLGEDKAFLAASTGRGPASLLELFKALGLTDLNKPQQPEFDMFGPPVIPGKKETVH